jgi:hypothetical protein
MSANNQPIFPLQPKTTWGSLLTANIAKDGTGTVVQVATGATSGLKIDQIKVRAKGTNVATVLRFFVNNGSTPTVAANNTLVHEVTVPATTLSEVAALADLDVTIIKNTTETACPIPYLGPLEVLYCTIGTTIAAGIQVTVNGGLY